MTFVTLAATFAVLVLFASALLLYGRRIRLAAASDLTISLHRIDSRAFETLLDPEDDAFLEASLPKQEFRKLQRQKIAVMIGYLHLVASNARMLMAVPQLCSDEQSRVEAQRVADEALRIRIQALRAIASLIVCYCFNLKAQPPNLTRYVKLKINFESLVRS